LWGRWSGSVWYIAIERGLAPIAAGLILSGGVAVLRASPSGSALWIAVIVSTALIMYLPRLHPLILFTAGGALFGLADAVGLW